MFRAQYNNTELDVEKVHWGTEQLWVEALRAKLPNPFQNVEEDEED